MKVKIGDTVYDWKDEPVMVILTDQDKKNIANMHPDCMRYCCYPNENFTDEEIKAWMKSE